MALNRDILKSGLIDMQVNQPKSAIDAARKWASLYHNYAVGAAAGNMAPVVLNPAVIEAQLIASPSGNFLVTLGDAITTYWIPVLWTSPGFTGVTASAIGANVLLATASIKMGLMTDAAAAAEELTNALHLHALTISVIMTNVSTGVTVPVTLL